MGDRFDTRPHAHGTLFVCPAFRHAPRLVVSGWHQTGLHLEAGATHFGLALVPSRLDVEQGDFPLPTGMYFSVPGAASIAPGGSGWVVSCHGYSGFFSVGGPVEATGRLRYIDGCSDSLLLAPVRRGDPCLNLLCFPSHLSQTRHTHPSWRAGVVLRGSGRCHTDGRDEALREGFAFVIPPHVEHAFATGEEEMTIVAHHPDSDFGPTDDDHPMINRTLIEGVAQGGSRGAETE